MKDEIIDAYLKEKESGATEFWPKLMKQFGFIKKEKIRSIVRRGLKERGLEVEPDKETSKSPVILLLDIETSPLQVFSWRIHDVTLSADNIIKDFSILCWSAKILGDAEVMGDVCTPEEAREGNDKRVVESMWKLLDKANIVITFNGANFDLRKLNSKFILHGLYPPSKYYSVDVYQTVKSNFGFSSNKLDYISKLFEFKGKIETNYELWKKCFYGEKAALDEMFTYNQNDVTELENVYLRVLPWIKNHPNVAIYSEVEEELCPKCGSEDLNWSGYYFTSIGKYNAFRCRSCGAIGRSKSNEISKEKKATLLTQG
jgi:RNase P subunit RPR2